MNRRHHLWLLAWIACLGASLSSCESSSHPDTDAYASEGPEEDGVPVTSIDETLNTTKDAASCAERTELRVVSLNTGAGAHQRIAGSAESCVESSTDARRIMALLMGVEPDRVNAFALQEVDLYRRRACTHPSLPDEPCGNHAKEFATSLGPLGGCATFETHYGHQLQRSSSCPDRPEDPDAPAGQYGNAWVADTALSSTDNWRLTNVCTDTSGATSPECRGAVVARIEFGGHDVWMVNTHLDCNVYEHQLQNLMGKIDDLPAEDAVLLAGDFNISALGEGSGGSGKCVAGPDELPRWNRLYAEAAASGLRLVSGFAPTAPAHNPSKTIDYIFLRDPQGLFSASTAHRISPAWYGWSSHYYTTDHIGVEVILETGAPRPPSLNWSEFLEEGVVAAAF